MIHQYTDSKNKGGVHTSNGMLPQLLHSAVVMTRGEAKSELHQITTMKEMKSGLVNILRT